MWIHLKVANAGGWGATLVNDLNRVAMVLVCKWATQSHHGDRLHVGGPGEEKKELPLRP